MATLEDCITSHISIDAISLSAISSAFTETDLQKGDVFLASGNICRQMAFIQSGYLRMFNIVDGKEITFWVGSESSFITSLSSFIFQTPNHWTIEALSTCSLMVINRTDHFELSKQQPKWLEFDNILLARSFALLEESMFSHLYMNATQRFDALMASQPAIFNHVPLQYIASMLGIAPETLSRLRKNLGQSTS